MPDGIQSTLLVPLKLSLLLGVFPLKRSPGATYVFSWKRFSYGIILGLGITSVGAYSMAKYAREYRFSFALLVDFFGFAVNTCTWAIVLLQFYLLRCTLPAIITELDEAHYRVADVSYGRFCSASIVAISLINAVPALFNILYQPHDWQYIILQLTYFVFTDAPVFVAGQYSTFLNILSRQLFSLTGQLGTASFNIEIGRLVDTHHTLCVLAERINQAYDIFLFQTITLTFVSTVMKLYVIIICIFKPDLYADEYLLFVSIVQVLVNCGTILLIVISAMSAKKNADRFNGQLLKNVLFSKDLAKDDKLRTYLATDHTIKQTACQFFSLDYSLLTSMGAGTATYVILLVQFTLL